MASFGYCGPQYYSCNGDYQFERQTQTGSIAEHTDHSVATRGGEANGHQAPKKAENVIKTQYTKKPEPPPPPADPIASEQRVAELFAGPGAYFSNPNDGDPFDKVLGVIRNPANSRTDPENHLYPSATDPNARTGFYVPEGGVYSGETTYTDGSGEKVRVILLYFAQLGGQKKCDDCSISFGEY